MRISDRSSDVCSSDLGRIETVRRLDASVNALLARAAPANGDGVVYLPVGAANPAGQGYGLPSDLANIAQTPFGQRFVYCPFGAAGGSGTAATITSANGSNYQRSEEHKSELQSLMRISYAVF